VKLSRQQTDRRDILLVEDNDSDERLLLRALQIAGVRNPIIHARSGKEALTYLAACEAGIKRVPAAMFIDLKLPDISGFDILSYAQRHPVFEKAVRIVVSQMGDVTSVKTAYSLGATTFLTKPATQEELEELIRVYPKPWQLSAPPEMLPHEVDEPKADNRTGKRG